jgi:hypothetical protein
LLNLWRRAWTALLVSSRRLFERCPPRARALLFRSQLAVHDSAQKQRRQDAEVKRTPPKAFEGSDAQRFAHIRDRISTGATFDELKFLIDLIERLDNIIWQQTRSRAEADEKAPREALKRVMRAVGELAEAAPKRKRSSR